MPRVISHPETPTAPRESDLSAADKRVSREETDDVITSMHTVSNTPRNALPARREYVIGANTCIELDFTNMQ